MTYDGDDRMRRLTHPDGSSEIYYYDANGARMLALEQSASGSPIRLRFWFDNTEIQYDASGHQTRAYVYVNLGTPVARIDDGGRVEYTHHNGLGHLLAVTSPSGYVEATFSYTPFGELLQSSGNAQDFDHRFNAKQTDLRSGISYYGYRYYDPLTLTWLRADPLYRFVPDLDLRNPRAMNLFSFSLNNPLRYVDPDGLQTAPEDMPDKGANWTVEPWDGSNSYVVKVRDVIVSPVHAPGGWEYVYSIVSYDNKVIPVFTPIITGWSKWLLKHHFTMKPGTKKAIDGLMIVASIVTAGISSGVAAAKAFEEGASLTAGKVAGELTSAENTAAKTAARRAGDEAAPPRLYRVVTEPEPEANMLSNAQKGLPPRGPEATNSLLHNGLSMFDNLQGAMRVAKVLKKAGKTVFGFAEVEPGPGLTATKTLGKGHYTVSGSMADLMSSWTKSLLKF